MTDFVEHVATAIKDSPDLVIESVHILRSPVHEDGERTILVTDAAGNAWNVEVTQYVEGSTA